MPSGRRHYRVTLADAIEAHELALATSGGRPGILRLDNIESALGRPYLGYHRSIHRKAAALLQSVVQNHGFVDGNKRTATLLVTTLLDRSGYELVRFQRDNVSREFEALVLGLADRSRDFEDALAWFQANCRPNRTA